MKKKTGQNVMCPFCKAINDCNGFTLFVTKIKCCGCQQTFTVRPLYVTWAEGIV